MAEVDATRACVVCGNTLTSKMDKKCCGADCSAEHRRRWMADRWNKRKPEMSRRQCAHCSAEFLTSHAKQQKYCGSACRVMAAKAQEGELSRCCVVCGREFTRCGHIKFCSDDCREACNRDHHRASALRNGRIKGPQQLTCAHCFRSFAGVANKVYCSRGCKDAARDKSTHAAARKAWGEKNAERVRAQGKEYKARVRAEGRRPDRSSEYEARSAKRLSESIKRNGERALGKIAAIGCERYAHVPALVARAARIIGKADAAARERIARARRPAGSGALSQHTINLKADRDRYAKDITRTRAKSYLRKTGNKMPDDGTASAVVLLGGSRCLYCDCALNDDNRSHDHMTPLSLGGVHSAANIAPACKRCNFRKGKKSFAQFVERLDEKHRRRAVAFYEKRNGPMVQLGLFLAA